MLAEEVWVYVVLRIFRAGELTEMQSGDKKEPFERLLPKGSFWFSSKACQSIFFNIWLLIRELRSNFT